MDEKKLKEVLENHKHWLNNDCDGWRNMRADLREADLSGADLREADLRGAGLSEADLREADLREADLRGAKNVPFIPLACPDTGAFVGFKKAKLYSPDESAQQDVIVELEILTDALRSSATGRKCRCDKAKVRSVTTLDGVAVGVDAGTVRSSYDSDFVYEVGEIVTAPNFCEDRWEECAPGIHFFINRQEAVEYEV